MDENVQDINVRHMAMGLALEASRDKDGTVGASVKIIEIAAEIYAFQR